MAPVSMKQNITPQKAKPASLQDMIERAYEAHPNSTKDASKVLEGLILVDEEVFFEVMKPHLAHVCLSIMNDGKCGARRAAWSGRGGTAGTAGKFATAAAMRETVVALAASNLMLFPLKSGLKLADATRGEIAETADYYAKLAADTGHKARWLTLIAQSLGEGEKVSDKFTEERLAELKKEAEHE